MIEAVFAIPGDLNTSTGGYVYDRQVMAALPGCGVAVRHLALPDGFPFPGAAALAETGRLLACVRAETPLVIDGLALGTFPPVLLEKVAAPIIALLHHPLGLETGLSPEKSRDMLAVEKTALTFAAHVIVTSPATAETLTELGFAPPPPVAVAIPGAPEGRRSLGSADGREIIAVGSVVPRKGYDVLVSALARLRDEPWRCTIVGGLDRDAPCADALQAQIALEGLADRVHLAGTLGAAEIGALLGKADIFALPSRYEGYGIVFAEAMAHGLPIAATNAPAIPGTVPPQAGILVTPDDVEAFSEALRLLMEDAALRKRFSDGAWMHAQTLPRWEDTAAIVAQVIKKIDRSRR